MRHQKCHRPCCKSSAFVSACTTRLLLNPLNPELNPICYLLALLAHHFLHVSRIRVKSLTFRLLMSYIYIYIYMERLFLMFLDHTQRRSTVLPTVLRRCVWSRNIKNRSSIYIYDISNLRVNKITVTECCVCVCVCVCLCVGGVWGVCVWGVCVVCVCVVCVCGVYITYLTTLSVASFIEMNEWE